MKPDWKDAPVWAAWLAMDSNGAWYWFSDEPTFNRGIWGVTSGHIMRAAEGVEAEDSLEERPK